MVYFKENKDLKNLKIITTFNGEKEYRKNCKYINQEYYTINQDCFEIEGNWFRKNSPDMVFDWETNQYIVKSKTFNLSYGIVRNKEGELELGYFTQNVYNNISTESNIFGRVNAISSDILGKDWEEDLTSHIWFRLEDFSTNSIAQKKTIGNFENPSQRGYNIEDNSHDFSYKRLYYQGYKPFISHKIKSLSKYLEDLTFGFEFEISQGFLPYHLQCRYGVVPCRDGSLNGGSELVTIPMSGAKGLQTIVNLADDLQERGKINLDCSLHIHFSNFGNDKLSVISLYNLCRSLQEELFSMFPYYKTDHNGIKQKNYTKKLEKLNILPLKNLSKNDYETYILDTWNKMFNFYSENKIKPHDFCKKSREHPVASKWNRPSRYYFFNFMNMFFTHRHTCEARLSGATLNKDKIVNWFLICIAIIKYSQKFAKQIITNDKTISLKEVLKIFPIMYPNDKKANFLFEYLHNYFLERQARCKEDLKKGDYKSLWDIKEDKTYKYDYQNENIIY